MTFAFFSSKSLITTSLLVSLTSSVSGLKANPKTAIFLFFNLPKRSSVILIIILGCSSLTSKVAPSIFDSTLEYLAAAANAFTSFGKQEPPKPAPALRNKGEILLSNPIPSATCSKSIPHSFDKFAISLAKDILAARNELEAYLINSAVFELHSNLVHL